MAVDLELARRKIVSFPLVLDPTGNGSVGIKPHGYGLNFDGFGSAGIASSAVGYGSVGIAVASIAPPVTPLAVHMAQGTILFAWDHPTPELVKSYQLAASSSLNGTYYPYQRGNFQGGATGRRGVVNNVPIGITAYFRLRALGINGAESTWVQVKKGKLVGRTASFKVRGIVGSTIPPQAIFSCVDDSTGSMLAIKTESLITIS